MFQHKTMALLQRRGIDYNKSLSNIRYEWQPDIRRQVGQYQNKYQFQKKFHTYMLPGENELEEDLQEHGQTGSRKSVQETEETNIIYSTKMTMTMTMIMVERTAKINFLYLWEFVYLQSPISNCTNQNCRHINYFCLLS